MKCKGLPIISHPRLVNWCKQLISQINYCEICDQALKGEDVICQHCLAVIPQFSLTDWAGDLLNRPEIYRLFRQCKFDHLISVTPYQYPINQWLTQYKYHRQLRYGALCNRLLEHQVLPLIQNQILTPPDLIIPVPIHINKWQQRGFNQCQLLANRLSKILGISVNNDVIVRHQKTRAQAHLSGKQRRKNLKGCFTVVDQNILQGKHVWLVDDIVTTGATANEISRQLKAANAQSITLITLAISA
ncbi:ComF family protein [Colwellia sp. MEBiC06753]